MSEQVVVEILDRAMSDPTFRALLERAPDEALAGYDLTPDERAAFGTASLAAHQLEERVSRTDLTGITTAKTGSPVVRPPSQQKRR